ncbi:YcxB family protein [Dyella nitratireducens]|uniref:YcxB family protein n=1 Tax=Dyella nitratireducens TaxID=1849580 RepID=UPI001662EDC8|nr:YcxB family protein [Dyella nitratireducens]
MERASITIQLTEDDYLQGLLFAAQRTRARWFFIGIMAVVCLGAGLLIVFYAPRDLFVLGWALIGAVVGGFIGRMVSRYIFLPKKLKERFAEQKALHRTRKLSWDDKGVTFESENGHVLIPWPDFFKFRENEIFVLLYTSRVIFLIVPKRFFKESEQLNDFMMLVHSSIGIQQNETGSSTFHI